MTATAETWPTMCRTSDKKDSLSQFLQDVALLYHILSETHRHVYGFLTARSQRAMLVPA